ncbi:hypothetical protein QWI17_01425 [Gilvimarinus sp. SDUM040013]|uniref:DUF4440 domain-containing protein n=1 Tax=Gilvimarinus gilvus TaxID=3058038 RepID=A0ABU4S4E7_9GAMM|nr:DUF4440 domain-containing protein [Gilvimarinus sp. SDUM040013]MDO3384492.1 hypothetical protein [Gilvimarinus sp. SDUM040013]MDX6850733.1 hypothetical protein [Gilvimarinus sp. SDUM040013]
MNIEATIIELEKSLLTFEVRRSEVELRKRIAPEFKEIGASGAHFSLDDLLERLPAEQSWSAVAQDFEFTQHSKDICQLVFRAFVKDCDSEKGTYSLRSSFWQKLDDGWKMIFHQGTKVEPFELAS